MNRKRKITILALAIVAIFAASFTIAYFTDQSDEVKNTFTMGNVQITLDEAKISETSGPSGTTWTVPNPLDRVLSNAYTGIYPSAKLPKDPTVKNTGSNPAYVRVKVTFTKHAEWKAILANPSSILGTLGTGWTFIGEAGGVYTFHNNSIVNAGVSTSPLFTEVSIPSNLSSAQMASISGFQINVIAEAIQAQGFANTAAAFAAYDAP